MKISSIFVAFLENMNYSKEGHWKSNQYQTNIRLERNQVGTLDLIFTISINHRIKNDYDGIFSIPCLQIRHGGDEKSVSAPLFFILAT